MKLSVSLPIVLYSPSLVHGFVPVFTKNNMNCASVLSRWRHFAIDRGDGSTGGGGACK